MTVLMTGGGKKEIVGLADYSSLLKNINDLYIFYKSAGSLTLKLSLNSPEFFQDGCDFLKYIFTFAQTIIGTN